MKKALIIGASGLIGSHLYKLIPSDFKVVGTFRNHRLDNLIHLDITKADETKKVIHDFKPDVIFLPTAFTNVELAEEKKDICRLINVDGVGNVVAILKNFNAKLIFFSTDYIFNGKDGPWDEEALPEPLGVYGESKLEGERIIANNLDNYLIIRTTWVYGWESQKKNFVVNLIKRKDPLRVPCDQVSTPTYAGDLAKAVWKLVREDKVGVYNIVGKNLMNRFDFACLVAEVFDLNKALILPAKTIELSQRAKRPLKAGLKTNKVEQELQIHMPQVKESLLSMKKEKANELTG